MITTAITPSLKNSSRLRLIVRLGSVRLFIQASVVAALDARSMSCSQSSEGRRFQANSFCVKR